MNANKFYGVKTIKFGRDDERTEARGNYQAKFVDWVNWGELNDFPVKFLERLNESAFYHRIVSTQVNMTAGDGLGFDGNQATIAEQYFQQIGIDEQFIKRAAWDVCVLNAFSCQIILDKLLTRPIKAYHCRADKIRVDKHLDQYDEVLFYWIAKDWTVLDQKGKVTSRVKEDKESFVPIRVPRYIVGSRAANSLIYNIEYNPAMHYYPVPPAEPAFKELDLSVKVVDFQNNAIDNGMSGTVIVKYPKKQHEDWQQEQNEQQQIAESLKEAFTGSKNAGTAFLVFYDPAAEAHPEIEQFPTDENDKKYIETNRIIREAIFSGLGVVSGELFGIPSSGGFSSQSEMLLTANELTYHNIIKPKQRLITEPLNNILKHAGIDAEVNILNTLPVNNRLTETMVTNGIISRDEFRESLGFETIEQMNGTEQNI